MSHHHHTRALLLTPLSSDDLLPEEALSLANCIASSIEELGKMASLCSSSLSFRLSLCSDDESKAFAGFDSIDSLSVNRKALARSIMSSFDESSIGSLDDSTEVALAALLCSVKTAARIARESESSGSEQYVTVLCFHGTLPKPHAALIKEARAIVGCPKIEILHLSEASDGSGSSSSSAPLSSAVKAFQRCLFPPSSSSSPAAAGSSSALSLPADGVHPRVESLAHGTEAFLSLSQSSWLPCMMPTKRVSLCFPRSPEEAEEPASSMPHTVPVLVSPELLIPHDCLDELPREFLVHSRVPLASLAINATYGPPLRVSMSENVSPHPISSSLTSSSSSSASSSRGGGAEASSSSMSFNSYTFWALMDELAKNDEALMLTAPVLLQRNVTVTAAFAILPIIQAIAPPAERPYGIMYRVASHDQVLRWRGGEKPDRTKASHLAAEAAAISGGRVAAASLMSSISCRPFAPLKLSFRGSFAAAGRLLSDEGRKARGESEDVDTEDLFSLFSKLSAHSTNALLYGQYGPAEKTRREEEEEDESMGLGSKQSAKGVPLRRLTQSAAAAASEAAVAPTKTAASVPSSTRNLKRGAVSSAPLPQGVPTQPTLQRKKSSAPYTAPPAIAHPTSAASKTMDGDAEDLDHAYIEANILEALGVGAATVSAAEWAMRLSRGGSGGGMLQKYGSAARNKLKEEDADDEHNGEVEEEEEVGHQRDTALPPSYKQQQQLLLRQDGINMNPVKPTSILTKAATKVSPLSRILHAEEVDERGGGRGGGREIGEGEESSSLLLIGQGSLQAIAHVPASRAASSHKKKATHYTPPLSASVMREASNVEQGRGASQRTLDKEFKF